MAPDHAERLLEVVGSALERDAAERSEFINKSCGDDFGFRAEVESLLAQQDRVIDFIEAPPSALAAEALEFASDETFRDKRLGPYRLVRKIGQGGMGAVYLAERDDRQYEKQVAIKIITFAFDADEVRRRFRHERQILAALDHPNIARLLDAGTSEEGLPYFVMEYVDAIPIDQYCKSQQLDIVARLELFRTVCSAVQYAHQNLVIHRDIKPGNILVTPDGVPKLLDFGVAKLLDPDPSHPLVRTITEVRALTPEYASPEQINGANVTTATDIYSLGVLLYELLTGQRPYRLKGHTRDEISRAITTQEPARPSARVSNYKNLRGDLDNIVLMAMRKEPARRYASVGQFSEDIRRHLEGLPVIARKDTVAYRTAKFVNRNKLGVAAAALVLLAVVGGMIAFAREAKVAAEERDQARIEKANAERVSAFLQNVLLLADPSWIGGGSSRGRELTTARLLETASVRARAELADQPAVLAGVLRSLGNTYRAQGEYDQAEQNLRDAREILSRTNGSQDFDTLNVTYNLAQCLMQAGTFAEAEALYRSAVQFFREHVDRSNDGQVLALAGALNDFAVLLRSEGNPQLSETLLHEALQFAPRWHGTTRAIVGIHLNNLGLARDDQGDLEGAEQCEREAIAELRRLPGGDRLEIGPALFSLGYILTTKGDYVNAETAIREGFAVYHRLVGDEHPSLALGLDRLARVQCMQGDFSAAQRSSEQAIAIQNAKLPAEHPQRSYQLTTLGIALTRAGSATEAEPHLRRALFLREKILPQTHWLLAETKLALGECLASQQRYAEAEPLLVESLKVYQTRLGLADPRTQSATARLKDLYEAWGKPEEAARRGVK